MIKLAILGAAMSLALVACSNQADNRDQMTDDSFDGTVTEESVLITVPEDISQPPQEPQQPQSMPDQPSQPSMDMNDEPMEQGSDVQSLYIDEMSISAMDAPMLEEALASTDLLVEDTAAN
ncbi:MAG: hypothetical protein GKR77_04480 [Legionellales bacterium]|nr:hypothetical protein [Legionellales bacterium]